MNKDQLLGNLKFVCGRLQEHVAVLLRDPVLRRRAQQWQVDGKVQHTIGEARVLIRRSLKQHMSV